MSHDSNQFYEECRQCRYAQFIDFDKMQCAKSAQFIPDTYCEVFEEIEMASNDHSTLGIAEHIDDILEKEKEEHIKVLEKQKRTEAIEIPEEENIKYTDRTHGNCLFTLQDVKVYNNAETKPIHVIRTIPKNEIVGFNKEVIRKSRDLFLLKEPSGKKSYIRKQLTEVKVCQQAHVKENSLDILMMSHKDFDIHNNNIAYESNKIKDEYRDHIHNLIDTVANKTIVKSVDVFSEDGKEYSAVNILAFNTKVENIELGSLQPSSIFYFLDDPIKKGPKKIILPNGTEGILLSKFPVYEVVTSNIEKSVNIISIIIVIGIVILGMGLILESSGYLFFWGILIFPIIFIVYIFFSIPLMHLLKQINKRI